MSAAFSGQESMAEALSKSSPRFVILKPSARDGRTGLGVAAKHSC